MPRERPRVSYETFFFYQFSFLTLDTHSSWLIFLCCISEGETEASRVPIILPRSGSWLFRNKNRRKSRYGDFGPHSGLRNTQAYLLCPSSLYYTVPTDTFTHMIIFPRHIYTLLTHIYSHNSQTVTNTTHTQTPWCTSHVHPYMHIPNRHSIIHSHTCITYLTHNITHIYTHTHHAHCGVCPLYGPETPVHSRIP